MSPTMQQAQPIVSGRSVPRRHRVLPVACLLTLLAVLTPELTLAPVVGGEDALGAPAPRDVAPAVGLVRLLDEPAARHATRTERPAERQEASASEFAAALEAARSSANAYGVTAAIVRDGRMVWSGAVGVRRDGVTRLQPDDTLVIGSVTKTFLAATILQLASEHAISLDDPVTTYLPATTIGGEITIRQLLDHTSGLADVFNDTTRTALEQHPEQPWTSDQVMGALHAPWYDPGENWAYANTNYLLLGLIIESVTGLSLHEALAERFLEPMALDDTALISATDADAVLSPAWATIFWGSGAMVSSAADLATWGDALYRGDVLSAPMRAAMLRPNRNDYGLGVQRLQLAGVTGFGHTGLLNTYTTLLFHLPSEDVTIALLVNRSEVNLADMLAAHPPNGKSLLELVGAAS